METVKKANVQLLVGVFRGVSNECSCSVFSIRGVSHLERVKYRLIFKSPTMQKVFADCARSLSEFDNTCVYCINAPLFCNLSSLVWFYIRGKVLEECKEIGTSVGERRRQKLVSIPIQNYMNIYYSNHSIRSTNYICMHVPLSKPSDSFYPYNDDVAYRSRLWPQAKR